MSPIKKISSLPGPQQVAAYMAVLKHPLKEVLEQLRLTILEADKAITEQIKWNAPSFCFNGDDRITANLHKSDQVLAIFHKGAKAKIQKGKEPLFRDTTGLLEWLAPDRAVLKLSSIAEVEKNKAAIKKLVKQWIKLTVE